MNNNARFEISGICNDGVNVGDVQINGYFDTSAEAEVFAAALPKSFKAKAGGRSAQDDRGLVRFAFDLRATGVTGVKNETASKRLAAVFKKIPACTFVQAPCGNFATAEQLAALV